MHQYCSVCKAHFDMSVVSESADDGVIWLKCPNCQGILPHMPETEEDTGADPASSSSSEATQSQPEPDFDTSDARPYSSDQVYEVGDVVHHRGWNDYGIVVEKQELAGGRHVIKVRFVENGELQLIENAGR